MALKNSWVWKTNPNQLPWSPANSLEIIAKKELNQLNYSQEAGGQLQSKKPESLLSAKHIEIGPCSLTTKHIHNACQEKPGWLSKVAKN